MLQTCNDPKFSDRQFYGNSVDPDQTAPRSSLIRVYTVCHSVSIFMMHYFMVKQPCSKFRLIKAMFSGVRMFTVASELESGWGVSLPF